MTAYVIKARVDDPGADAWTFLQHKTMYGGKHLAVGDTVFVWASEHEGGAGLLAQGRVAKVQVVPLRPGLARQTPRVDVQVQRDARARHSLSRADLRHVSGPPDAGPEAELAFKLCRQATNKVVGIAASTAAFLAARCG